MKLSTILVAFLLIATVYAGAIINSFNAYSENDNIKLEWMTGTETDLQKFVIERKTLQSSYIELTTIYPKGDNSYYSYIDQNVYKATSNLYKYRLKIVDNNNQTSYSQEITISHSISSIYKKTWGSIKAMFR